MMTTVVVEQYETYPDRAEENQRLLEHVLADLNDSDPGGFDFTVFRAGDGVGFVHVTVFEGEANPLTDLQTFRAFREHADERLVEPATVVTGVLIDAYGTPVEQR